MKKVKLTALSLFLSCLFVIFSFGTAPCFMLLDGKLEITGFLENWSAWRFEDGYGGLHSFRDNTPVHISVPPGETFDDGLEAGDYYLCRNTIQVEFNYEMMEF